MLEVRHVMLLGMSLTLREEHQAHFRRCWTQKPVLSCTDRYGTIRPARLLRSRWRMREIQNDPQSRQRTSRGGSCKGSLRKSS